MSSITSRLGISPVSLSVVDAVIQYSRDHQIQLMLIASRNQINLKGGYVEGFTPQQFVDYVRWQNGNVLICRDHLGPYTGEGESELKPEAALEQACHCVVEDVAAGFDLLHIDCGRYVDDVREATSDLIGIAISCAESFNRPIMFEVGTEQNLGITTDHDKFRADLEFIASLIKPEFVVGQTGSLVKEVRQVGNFDPIAAGGLVDVAHSFGVKFKEHNVDYSSLSDLNLRKMAGVDAINVGPEFGVIQTQTIIELANRYGVSEELDAFLYRAYESGKWRKWVHDRPSNFLKAMMAGHYVFDSDEYRELVDKLNTKVNVDEVINQTLFILLDHYVRGLT